MKKIFAGIVTMGLVLVMGGTTAFAAGPGRGCYFVDADGDGICDNAGSMCVYADSDGDGICDNCGTYHWCGMAGTGGGYFVDADNDGICDNYESGQCRGGGYGCGFGGRGYSCRGGRCR